MSRAVTSPRSSRRSPATSPGAPAGKAPEAIADEGIAQLASNESPFGPHPAVAEAIARAAGGHEPLPGPERRRCCAAGSPSATRSSPAADRARQRLLRDPARRRARALRARRRARLRLALVLDVPVPGAALGRPRDPGAARRRATSTTSTRCSPRSPPRPSWSLVCNPNNPTATHIPAARIAEFLRAGPRPRHRDPRRGLRRVPARRRPRRDRRPAPRVPEPGRACAPSARSTGSPACGSATRSCSPAFRAAVDAVRQPFSVNALAQAAAAEAIRHADDVADRVERNDRRAGHGRGGRPRARARDARLAGQLLLGRPRRRTTRREVVAALAERGILVRARHAARRPGPHPGQLRHPGRERAVSSPRSLTRSSSRRERRYGKARELALFAASW